nr:hypothetical protein [Dyella sp. ASV24]
MASSFAMSGVYAAPKNSGTISPIPSTPQVSEDTIDMSDPQAQVVASAGTTNGTGNQVTIRSVQAGALPDAPRPSFESLDTNHDGFISESEAEAYSPLANDYLYLAPSGSRGVTREAYRRWRWYCLMETLRTSR